jgi:protein-S-isoprenylcysteine O-methyltransferase Ste14
MAAPELWPGYRSSLARVGSLHPPPVGARTSADANTPTEPDERPLVIANRIFNVLVPLCCILFAWAHLVGFIHTLRISILIILAKAALEIQFYVRKYTGPFVSTSAYAWLIALCGTVAPLMLRPTDDPSDFSLATLLQVMGLAMQVYVIRALNETAVARHGIGRDGLYRFVRHPLYVAFMFSQYGYVLNHASFYNLCVLAVVTVFQVLRINEEERLLEEDEEFQGYAEQTRWRVIPGVF